MCACFSFKTFVVSGLSHSGHHVHQEPMETQTEFEVSQVEEGCLSHSSRSDWLSQTSTDVRTCDFSPSVQWFNWANI